MDERVIITDIEDLIEVAEHVMLEGRKFDLGNPKETAASFKAFTKAVDMKEEFYLTLLVHTKSGTQLVTEVAEMDLCKILRELSDQIESKLNSPLNMIQ